MLFFIRIYPTELQFILSISKHFTENGYTPILSDLDKS